MRLLSSRSSKEFLPICGSTRVIHVLLDFIRLARKFLRLFWKISFRTVERSRSFDTKGIDRGCGYCSNERLSIDMDAHKRAEMNIFLREILAPLLHEFCFGSQNDWTNEPKYAVRWGRGEMSIRTTRYWFDRFRNRKDKLEDEHRSKVCIDLFEQLIKQDSRLMTRCSVEQLECPHTTIERLFAALGESWKIWGVNFP